MMGYKTGPLLPSFSELLPFLSKIDWLRARLTCQRQLPCKLALLGQCTLTAS